MKVVETDVETGFGLVDRAGAGGGQERVPARLLGVLADQQAGNGPFLIGEPGQNTQQEHGENGSIRQGTHLVDGLDDRVRDAADKEGEEDNQC